MSGRNGIKEKYEIIFSNFGIQWIIDFSKFLLKKFYGLPLNPSPEWISRMKELDELNDNKNSDRRSETKIDLNKIVSSPEPKVKIPFY